MGQYEEDYDKVVRVKKQTWEDVQKLKNIIMKKPEYKILGRINNADVVAYAVYYCLENEINT